MNSLMSKLTVMVRKIVFVKHILKAFLGKLVPRILGFLAKSTLNQPNANNGMTFFTFTSGHHLFMIMNILSLSKSSFPLQGPVILLEICLNTKNYLPRCTKDWKSSSALTSYS